MIRTMMAKYEEAVSLTRMTGERLLNLKFRYYKIEDHNKNPLYKIDVSERLIRDPHDKRELERDCIVIKNLDEIIYSLNKDTHDKVFLLLQKRDALKSSTLSEIREGESTVLRSPGGSRETRRWIGWIQKALDDLQKIQSTRTPKTSLQIKQELARGILTLEGATGEARASLLEIEYLIQKEREENFSIQDFADEFEKAIATDNQEQEIALASSIIPILEPYGIRFEEIADLLNITIKYSPDKAEGRLDTYTPEAMDGLIISEESGDKPTKPGPDPQTTEEMDYFKEYVGDFLQRHGDGYIITGKLSSYIKQIVDDFPSIETAMLYGKLYERDGTLVKKDTIKTLVSRFKEKKARM